MPLYKNKGPVDDPDNYRGITLLSCLGKLFTAVINERLTMFLESSGTIGDEQAGFRAGFSTVDHIFVLRNIIQLYTQQKKRLYCAFIDYKKAFDLVDRCSLWLKLISVGINGKVLRVIYNMYQNAKSCVRVGGSLSDFFPCNTGVRQGENLSPVLFAIYLNDFDLTINKQFKGLSSLSELMREHLSDDDVEYFIKVCSLLYADDTIVLAESASELQDALNAVHTYCENWNLAVNTSKTKIMIFSRGRVKKAPRFTYGPDCLEVVSEYVYLGTLFSSNSSMKPAVMRQIDQARRALFKLRSMTHALGLSVEMQCELYDKLVAPVLLYGSEVWGLRYAEAIEKFERKFLKAALKVNKFTANCMAFGELGRHRARVAIQMRLVNFWMRIEKGKQSKLSCILYHLMAKLSKDNLFHFDWIDDVKHTLVTSGFSYIWDCAQTEDASVIKSIQQRLNDMEAQQWHTEVSENSLCTNYKLIKEKHEAEPYLSKVSDNARVIMTRFRCGNHNLPVTVSRRKHSSEPCPICPLCTKNCPGDEYHYVLECPYFAEERTKFIPTYFRAHTNTLKYKQLFNSENTRLLYKVGKYLNIVVQHFK